MSLLAHVTLTDAAFVAAVFLIGLLSGVLLARRIEARRDDRFPR